MMGHMALSIRSDCYC